MTIRFSPLLAHKILAGKPEVIAANLSKVRFPVVASPKFDGWRLFEYNGLPTTRSLKQPKNYHTVKVLAELFRALKDRCGVVGVDGEAIAGEVFHYNAMQHSTSAFGSYEGEPEFTYMLFDSYQYRDRPYQERLDRLRDCFLPTMQSEFPWAQVVDSPTIHNMADLMAYEQQQIALGAEGIMTRIPDSTYKMGRSTLKDQTLMAWKRWASSEALILGVNEQMHNANVATINALGNTQRSSHQENMIGKNTMGSVTCRDPLFDETFTVGMGRGLNDALRKHIWENPELYVGQHLTYEYQDIGVKVRPRMPRWVGIRAKEDMGK